MGRNAPTPIRVPLGDEASVGGLLLAPAAANACFVFGHGAGAGMAHPFMSAFALGLAERDIATLRYQFPFMERRSKRPDAPSVAHAAVRAAVAEAGRRCSSLPLLAGGKSFGGRMTSQAQAEAALAGVAALAFVGFPLHPARKPSAQRAQHLSAIGLPMLFLQGTRDDLADVDLLKETVEGLGPRAALAWFADANHSFHVPARSGRTDEQVMAAMLDRFAEWASGIARR